MESGTLQAKNNCRGLEAGERGPQFKGCRGRRVVGTKPKAMKKQNKIEKKEIILVWVGER